MIKNFDEFVNGNEQITEGLDSFAANLLDAITAGVAAFKSSRYKQKAFEKEQDFDRAYRKMISSGDSKYDSNTELAVLVNGILSDAAWVAETFVKYSQSNWDNEHKLEPTNSYGTSNLDNLLRKFENMKKAMDRTEELLKETQIK
jgi:hypothetical protein